MDCEKISAGDRSKSVQASRVSHLNYHKKKKEEGEEEEKEEPKSHRLGGSPNARGKKMNVKV